MEYLVLFQQNFVLLSSQCFFLIPPNPAFHGLLEEFLFPSAKIQNFYHINNQFVIKISTFYDSAYYNFVMNFYIKVSWQTTNKT